MVYGNNDGGTKNKCDRLSIAQILRAYSHVTFNFMEIIIGTFLATVHGVGTVVTGDKAHYFLDTIIASISFRSI